MRLRRRVRRTGAHVEIAPDAHADARSQVVAEGDLNAERILVSKSLPQVRDRLDELPDGPVTYLVATQPIDVPPHWPLDKLTTAIRTHQARFVALFPRGKLVPVDSGHDIPRDVTVEHVQAMIDATR
jgi:hypothetical protein